MSITTPVLILAAEANPSISSPGFNPSWTTTPAVRYLAVPEPNIGECPFRFDIQTGAVAIKGGLPGGPTRQGIFQWVSPPLSGNQTFTGGVDTVLIEADARDNSGLGAGHDIGGRTHMRIVDSAGADRGSSLITFASVAVASPLPRGVGVTQVPTPHFDSSTVFYNDVLENTVNALDGDHIVVELGYHWDSHGLPGSDADNHGPGQMMADEYCKVTFSKDVVFQDYTADCLGAVSVGPILASGGGNVLAPSCDNAVLGG